MTNDTDRREAARRLREFADDYVSDGVRAMNRADANDRLFKAIGFDYLDRANWVFLGDELPDLTPAYARRLADLIVPSEPKVRCVAEVKVDGERLEKLVHDAAAELTGIDRDALLEIAAELDHPIRQAVWNQSPGARREHVMREYARRIREALGATEDE